MNKNDNQKPINLLKKNSFLIGLLFVLGGLALCYYETITVIKSFSYQRMIVHIWLSAEIIGGISIGFSEIMYGTKKSAISKLSVFGILIILSLIVGSSATPESYSSSFFFVSFLSFTIVLVILILMLSIKLVLLFIKKQRSKNKL